MVTTVTSGLNELLLQAQSDESKVSHVRGRVNSEGLEVCGSVCIVLVGNAKQALTRQHIEGLHGNQGILLGIMSNHRVNHGEINLIGELHVTTILESLHGVLLNGALIRHGRHTLGQGNSVSLQGSPTSHLQLISLILNRGFIREPVVYILVRIVADSIQKLLGVKHFRIDFRPTIATRSIGEFDIGIDVCCGIKMHSSRHCKFPPF